MGVGLCLWRVVGWVYRGWCGEMCVGLSGGGCWIFGGPQDSRPAYPGVAHDPKPIIYCCDLNNILGNPMKKGWLLITTVD